MTWLPSRNKGFFREEVGTNVCMVGKIVKRGEMGWTHGQNRMKDEIAETICDKETRRLQKTRKTTAIKDGRIVCIDT